MNHAASPDLVLPARTGAARTLAVASGKGGVGKTWFAITLAHALARQGQSVLLFDGDLGLANVDVQLGLSPARDLAAVASGRARLEEAVIRSEACGFDVLAGRSGSGALATVAPAALEAILEGLAGAARHYDRIVLDLGAGLDRPVRRMASWADTTLVVATEEPTSLTDAYAVLKLHAADRGRDAQIVVNQAASPVSGARTYATLARACANFLGHTPRLAGVIRRDERVREALRRQAPLLTRHPATVAAADVEAIATSLG